MDNRIAKILKTTAKCIWFLGFLAAIYLGFKLNSSDETFSFLIAASAAGGSFLMGLFTIAIGEIICILHDIRAKSYVENDTVSSETSKPAMYVEDMSAPDAPQNGSDSTLEQVDSFIWICTACGEINLSSSNTCRICKAGKP